MWPIKRKKKSARKELKTVYFYPNDYVILKGISKERKMSMTAAAQDMMGIYFGYQEGVKESEIRTLKLERAAALDLIKKLKDELDLYKLRFGRIDQ
jgi:hypothetical protein